MDKWSAWGVLTGAELKRVLDAPEDGKIKKILKHNDRSVTVVQVEVTETFGFDFPDAIVLTDDQVRDLRNLVPSEVDRVWLRASGPPDTALGGGFATVAIVTSRGTVRFAGDCGEEAWGEPLQRWADQRNGKGDQRTAAQLLQALIAGDAVTTTAANSFFFGRSPSVPWIEQDPWARNLFPGDVPVDVAARYDRAGFAITIPSNWTSFPASLCVFVKDGGWAGCVPLSDGPAPIRIPLYTTPSAIAEVWVLRAGSPIGSRDDRTAKALLGTVPLDRLANGSTAVLTVEHPARSLDELLTAGAVSEAPEAPPLRLVRVE